MAKRRRRRNWTDDEKLMICEQTRLPGVSVSQVARRYDVNANQVFNWLKDPKFAASPEDFEAPAFVPVEIGPPPTLETALITADKPACRTGSEWIEIAVPGGCTVRVCGSFDPEALARLIQSLLQ